MTLRALIPPAFRASAERLGMSAGIVAAPFVFLSGATGSDAEGRMPVDPETQFRAAFDKIALTLAEAGLGPEAIVEMTSYHIGLRDHFERFDKVRRSICHEPWPAWAAVEVAGLRRQGALVEIRVVARAAA